MVIFYSLDLFRRAKIDLNKYMLSMLAQGGISIGYITAPFLMNRVSRKLHYIVAGTFMVCNLVAAAFIIHLEVGYLYLYLFTFKLGNICF